MSKSVTASPVTIKAPKITTAWNSIVKASATADARISKATTATQEVIDAQTALVTAEILKLASVVSTESGLSIADMRKVIKDSGKESSFIKVSHVQGLPTLLVMRAELAGFIDLPIAKQLSTATASVELLGTGKGEKYASAEILASEIAQSRAEKNAKRSTPKDEPKSKKSNLDVIKAFHVFLGTLDEITTKEANALSELAMALESMSVIA
jgi:hypothetical protein